MLENELQKSQKQSEQNDRELRSQIDELKKDNDRQQKLIGQVMSHDRHRTSSLAALDITFLHDSSGESSCACYPIQIVCVLYVICGKICYILISDYRIKLSNRS